MSTRVRILGTGLIGTSVGLALSRQGYDVTLWDPSPTAMGLARDLGAGRLATAADDAPGAEPEVVVVASPPDVAGSVVAESLSRWPHAVVTDVASVKSAVLQTVRASGSDLSRYVGSHPMAGRERSGAVAARSALFDGRAWVVVPHDGADPAAVTLVARLATDAGAALVTQMSPQAHDDAVAAVSHLPQLAASLVAAQLRGMSQEAVEIAGQGLRDVTRIAASEPGLWTQILAGNAASVRDVLVRLQGDLSRVVEALDQVAAGGSEGALEVLARTISNGNAGHALIPGKHGAVPTAYGIVQSAGLLFFAFAGYARIATLGEEVRDPAMTIPRAITRALGMVIALYAVLALLLLATIGADGIAASPLPLLAAAQAADVSWVGLILRVGATVASLGALLGLMSGVGRTAFAMAREGDLPPQLATVDEQHHVPAVAQLALAAAVVLLVAVTDLRHAIGFSSFGVLTYYAIANLSAWTQDDTHRRWPRPLQLAGLAGCVLLAITLPIGSVLVGAAVIAAGVVGRSAFRRPEDSAPA